MMKFSFPKISKQKYLNKKIALCAFGVIIIVLAALAINFYVQDNKPSEPAPVVAKKTIPKSVAPLYTDFHLLIPALKVSVPVIADVDGNDKTAYFKALQGGVAQYKGTAKPGEGGNIFIFGHSSYYASDPGKFKTIFATLGDLKKGDEMSLWYNSKEYQYLVSKTYQVDPTDVSVLNPTKTEQLTLMTCWPPGTTKKRLIIIAKPK